MGMGHAAALAVTIEQEQIENLKLKSFTDLLGVLKQHEVNIDELAQATNQMAIDSYIEKPIESYINELADNFEIDADKLEPMISAYLAFKQEFNKVTNININLYYHNSDEGDRYDSVQDAYFELEFQDVYQLNDNAKKLSETSQFEISTFVVYG